MSAYQIQVTKGGLITLPKELRDANCIQDGDLLTFIDFGSAFFLTPQALQADKLTDRLAEQWRTQGESLETMLQTLREVRDEYGSMS